MCGIVGIWEFGRSNGGVELSLLERMRDTMVHRGPNDAGANLFDDDRGGVGFRRLSIIDLSPAGKQPMIGCQNRLRERAASSSSQNLLVFNGEIYNHELLRSQLESRGHRYHSHTDSETIIHLYEERRTEMVHEIEGDFAIAIWDGETERLSLYRDRLGVKPLYYTIADGRIIFASEIKAIVEHPAVERDIDNDSLADYLTFLTTPAPRTFFKGINKLPAGHRLVISRDGDAKVERYWDAFAAPDARKMSEVEYQTELLRLLRESIRKRMMSDVPFGVFLSGGVDSSANVALMSELMDRPVQTFTVGFEQHEYLNELDSARRVSQLFGTDHHEIVIGESDVKGLLPDLLWHLDEPLADPVCVPLYFVSKLAHDSGTTVIQTGEGADEVFSGYDKYVRYLRLYETLWKNASSLPTGLKRGFAAMAKPMTASNRTAAELARRFGAAEPLFWGAAIGFDEEFKQKLLTCPALANLNGRRTLDVVHDYLAEFEHHGGGDFLSEMIYLELKLRLPELLLMRIDKVTMANSIETRVPFLDHHLVEFAASIPSKYKVVGRTGKHVLKRALETVLPHDILYAKKRGFGAPIREWFRSELVEQMEAHFFASPLMKRELFDVTFIRRLLDEHVTGKRDWSFQLWALLNLGLWYERWIDPAR
jgi:asparagine synthase (glutamine-hydrolysing)